MPPRRPGFPLPHSAACYEHTFVAGRKIQLGGRDSNPRCQDQNPVSCQLDDPPKARVSDRTRAARGYPDGAMAERFTVLIMAAGRGTRMRSSPAQGAASRLRASRWSSGSSTPRARPGADRIVCVTRPGDGVAEGLPDGVEVAEQRRGRGHRRRRARRARALTERRGTVVVLSGDHPLVTAEHDRRARRRARAATARPPPCSPPKSSTPRATDGSCAARTARSSGSWRPSTRRASRPRSSPSARSTSAPTPSTAAAGRARSTAVELENGERYLTGVVPDAAREGGAVAAHRPTIPPARSASTTAPS